MKLETFFEKFDELADAPDAVAKMRELVLQLAVTGKLVAQDNRDEPASLLLEWTHAERAKLVTAKKIKLRAILPVQSDKQPFDLPSSWAWARLFEVGYELGQKIPDRRFTYIDVGGIDSYKGCISDRVEKLGPDDAPSRARKLVARGTVIYSTVRPYLLNIAIVDQDFDPEPIASTAFGILHPFNGINNRYLFYWLRSAPFTEYVEASMKGMAYPAINDEKFYSGPIALPPIAEQKRIVAKVDELMALCDRLEEQQQERETRLTALARASLARFADAPTPTNLEFLFHSSYTITPTDLRKSILTLAVKGKLVPQDPNDEPAEELLSRLIQFKLDHPLEGRSGRSKESTAESFEMGDNLPSSWAITTIGEVLYVIRGASPRPKGDPKYFSESRTPYHWVKISDIRKHGKKGLLMDTDEFLTEAGMRKSVLLPKGTLVLTNSATIGVPIVLGIEGCCIHDGYLAFPNFPHEFLSQKFVLYLFQSLKEHAEKNARGLAQLNLNSDLVRSFLFGLPPLVEQRRIVVKVEQLMAFVDQLEKQLTASQATSKRLIEAVVAELESAA